MSDEPSAELFERLIDVGSRADLSPSVVRDAFPELSSGESRSLYPRIVPLDTSRYSPSDLEAALRAMTLCERELRLSGGSVSRVIVLFKELARRDRARANQLAGWLVDNRGNNDYIPWGSRFASDARSFEEREDADRKRSEAARRREREEAERQRIKAESRRRAGMVRVERRQEAARIRQERISELVSNPDTCLRVVTESDETVDYWPASVADMCRQLLPDCTQAELHSLLSKVNAGGRSDHWRALKASIRSELDLRREAAGRGSA